MDTMNTSTTNPAPATLFNGSKCFVDRHESVTAMKAIIMVASCLSIIGALTIIFVSYCKGERRKENTGEALRTPSGLQNPETSSFTSALTDDNATGVETRREERHFWKERTVQHPARLILVCISAADILVAISHIWGVTNNYANLQHTSIAYKWHGVNISAESTECGAQAVLAIFGAISSLLWSDLLALMAVLMLKSSKKLKPAYFVSYRAFVCYNIFCWGVPLIIVCVLGGVNAIGFEEGIDVGWCYIHAHYDKKRERLWWMFFSYELWVSGSMLFIILMVVMFWTIFCAAKLKKRRAKDTQNEQRQQLVESVRPDEKGCCGRCCVCSKPMIMIVAAASLIVFRIWATSLDFLLFRSITGRSNFHCTLANPIILALAGFGNSSQGLVNFFIFIVFTGECCKQVYSLCGCRKQRML